ncbi:unnamed protein product [Trichobilharzia regenti]|nr:unnamed protein product [Trichobilharzia regenti]
MAEIDFLSAELDHDEESRDEEGDSINSLVLSKKISQPLDHPETVEICQKTVNPNNRVNAENFNIQRVIGKGGYGKILTAPLRFPPSFSSEVISLIRGLLRRDPNERLGSKEDVDEIKRHKFFKRHEINWSDVYHRRLKPPFRPKLTAENDVSMFDPSFTRLQPVVSPVDGVASIPPDMFQHGHQETLDQSAAKIVLHAEGLVPNPSE